MFKGKVVSYEAPRGSGDGVTTGPPVPVIRNFDGSVIRIWFPAGAPPYNKDTEAPDDKSYDEKTLGQWNSFVQTGRFDGGVMPEIPPKREFCTWDF
jgi:nucleoporin NUP42